MSVGGTFRGRLLVAMPPLVDPNFDRTVVLVLEHNDEGALGVVLNRPGDRTVADVVPAWGDVASDPAVVFAGGPVEPDAVIGLARAPTTESADGWAPVLGAVGTVDLSRDPIDVPGPLEWLRLFAGYAGWGAGQLEAEVTAGAWIVTAPESSDAFGDNPDGLWRAVLARQPGRVAWMANYPDDPSLN